MVLLETMSKSRIGLFLRNSAAFCVKKDLWFSGGIHLPHRKISFERIDAVGAWDDTDWMKQNDPNQEAYKKLDVKELKPFPEFRNVAVGVIWPDDAYDLVWRRYFEKLSPRHLVTRQENEWVKFVEEHGYSPEEYLDSNEFEELYGGCLIWLNYRRNHKGSRQMQKTRKSCITSGKVSGNPCPLCRDKSLLLNFKNLKLLSHFLDPHSGAVHHSLRTGVCRLRQYQLEQAIWLARDQGCLAAPVKNSDSLNLEQYEIGHPAVKAVFAPFS